MIAKKGCRYAIIRFRPYVETEEFANIGLLLACPKTGFFGFKLEEKPPKRLGGFFSNLDHEVYKKAILHFKEELVSIQERFRQCPPSPEQMRIFFEQFIHPRESIVQFSLPKATLQVNPSEALESLFNHYVNHSFATQSYQAKLNEKVSEILNELNKKNNFSQQSIGNEVHKVQFPFVDKNKEFAIKPIHLSPNTDSINKGYEWLGKIKGLEKSSILNRMQRILFAFEMPEESIKSDRHKSFLEFFFSEFEENRKIQVIDNITKESISSFFEKN